ncbi:hypothetical protein CDAR_79181 [Caerostris darwini]|uniref:Uncharacterized protein n=1 Tax=Caerostris darwini TaxID=1538125 RepID=A0AAV4S7T4_9ARAC|nr:hypothetical protein CDAR_79181 [Caerostris darwini]
MDMWCGTQLQKCLYYIPGQTGFSPEFVQPRGRSYYHQAHRGTNYDDDCRPRYAQTRLPPGIKLELRQLNLERGDSGYLKCTSCTYDRYVRPAGLPSREPWQTQLEAEDEALGRERHRTRDFRDDCHHRHRNLNVNVEWKPLKFEKGDSDYEKLSDLYVRPAGLPSREMKPDTNLERPPKQEEKVQHSTKERRYSRHKAHFPPCHPHYEGYRNVGNMNGYNKHQAIRGNYDLEKQQVSACVHLPNKQNTKRSYHNTCHIKPHSDYAKSRYYCPDERPSKEFKKNSCSCKCSTKPRAVPDFAGFLAGVRLAI